MKQMRRLAAEHKNEIDSAIDDYDHDTDDPNIKFRILHIEDSPFDAKWLTSIVHSSSDLRATEVIHTRTVQGALALLEAERFDLVVTDLELPDSTREMVVRRLQKGFPQVPSLVLTGNEDRSTANACICGGASDYFIKRFTRADELVRALKFTMTADINKIYLVRSDSE